MPVPAPPLEQAEVLADAPKVAGEPYTEIVTGLPDVHPLVPLLLGSTVMPAMELPETLVTANRGVVEQLPLLVVITVAEAP